MSLFNKTNVLEQHFYMKKNKNIFFISLPKEYKNMTLYYKC